MGVNDVGGFGCSAKISCRARRPTVDGCLTCTSKQLCQQGLAGSTALPCLGHTSSRREDPVAMTPCCFHDVRGDLAAASIKSDESARIEDQSLVRDPRAPGEKAHELRGPPGGFRARLLDRVLLRPPAPGGRRTSGLGTSHCPGGDSRPGADPAVVGRHLGADRLRGPPVAPGRTGRRAHPGRVGGAHRRNPGVPAPGGRGVAARVARGTPWEVAVRPR